MIKINFGCGNNRLEGWQNHDLDIDISKPLPFPNNYADFILAEHCIEHITHAEALDFFKECHRILKVGGVFRVCIPDIERIYYGASVDYCRFISKKGWGENSKRGAVEAIVKCHGHQSIWNCKILDIYFAVYGFSTVILPSYKSCYVEMNNIDGHGKEIGEEFNLVETTVIEGIK